MFADPKSQAAKARAVVVEIKNSGSMIRNIYMEGNDIVAEVETLASFKGPDFANLITVDEANIGFSARLFAQLKPRHGTGTVMEVCGPFKAITYDTVSNPSHSSARIINFINEGVVDPEFYNCITQEFVSENEYYNSNSELRDFFVENLSDEFNKLSHTDSIFNI